MTVSKRVCGRSGECTWIVVQGGRASARETVGRAATGAKKLLAAGVEVAACVAELGE